MPTSVPQLSTRRQILRAGFAAAVGSWAAIEVLGAGHASADPYYSAVPRVSMVGDSLTCGSLPFQPDDFVVAGWSHSAIDAYVSRGVRTKVKADLHTGLTAVDAIRQSSGDTEAWIVALGTNDAVIYSSDKHAQVIGMMMDHIGGGHKVMWVNVYLPDRLPQQLAWNASLDDAQRRERNMFVYDWASFAADNQRFLAHDNLHYNRDGYRYRSIAVGLASRALLPSNAAQSPMPRWPLSRQEKVLS